MSILTICWLVVWNIFCFPFYIWDNPSHWLIFFKMVKATNQKWLFTTFEVGGSRVPPLSSLSTGRRYVWSITPPPVLCCALASGQRQQGPSHWRARWSQRSSAINKGILMGIYHVYMFHICFIYMFHVCFIYVSYMFQICFRYVSDMFQICFRYVSYMFQISHTSMFHIW